MGLLMVSANLTVTMYERDGPLRLSMISMATRSHADLFN